MTTTRHRQFGVLLLVLLAGCSSVPEPAPGPGLPPDLAAAAASAPATAPAPVAPMPPLPMPTPPGQVASGPAGDAAARTREMIVRLLPPAVKDKAGWAADLQTAYASLNIPPAPATYCAAIAVIEQESGFQADPVVPGLPAIVWRELERRGARYGIPRLVITTAMLKRSPDGRSYRQRIDALRTERQLDRLFEDMIAELPFGRRLFADYNPVHTAGPMQVSVDFAEQQLRRARYPYPLKGSVRDEVFTRRGGLYFGSAILLDYPAPYSEVVYRFADFNAGRYSSRNAAFQQALARLSGQPLATDGDLLRYERDRPTAAPSSVELAARRLRERLRLSPAAIRHDLLLEKTAGFAQTALYTRVYGLADARAGHPLPRQAMPRIDLKSPKITRRLTTEWFARRVEGRYRNCLGRGAGGL